MGGGTFTSRDWGSYRSATLTKSTAENFSQKKIHKTFDPKGISVRESRDSEEHPESTAIILGLDVTGSMGMIAQHIAKESLGKLMLGIYESKPVHDPQIMVMGLGDASCDRAPIQASQFESDIRIGQQLLDLFLEGAGGGNDSESYDFAWHFAAFHTSIDCFEKRGKKGYLFTFGDELFPYGIKKNHVLTNLGYSPEKDFTGKELFDLASEKYDVFHLVVEQGNYCRGTGVEKVLKNWRNQIGFHAIPLNNYEFLSEVILSVMRVNEGEDVEDVILSWQDSSIQSTVRRALTA